MSVELELSPISSGYQTSKINDNFLAIETAFSEVLGRNGTVPNTMNADIDLDGNDLLNVGTVTVERFFIGADELVVDEAMARGEKGDTGDTGATGPQGASGPGTGDLLAAQNLSDVDNAATAFSNIKQAATESASGVLEIATNAEVVTGTDTGRAVVPSALMAFYIGQNLGKVFDYTGPTAPALHLFPYGQAVSRTTYAAYFALVGTTYGVGDGSTTFNLPDLRGRVVAGKDDMGGVSATRLDDTPDHGITGTTLGSVGGEDTHTLIGAEMPAHTHSVTSNGSRHGLNGSIYSSFRASDGDNGNESRSQTMTSTTAGLSDDHNNVQPTMVLNKILFVGV